MTWPLGLVIQLKRGSLAVRRFLSASGRGLQTIGRALRIAFLRALFRVRRMFSVQSAWTFAGAAGTLGIVLMTVLQIMYSFQKLGARESAQAQVVQNEQPKTRIDPGLPQHRKSEPPSAEPVEFDPFAPAQPAPQVEQPPIEPFPSQKIVPQPEEDPFSPAVVSQPIEPEPDSNPFDSRPVGEPLPAEPPPVAEPPLVVEPASEPFVPTPAVAPHADRPAEPTPSEFPPFEPEPMPEPVPNDVPPVQPSPPVREAEPFVDPLDLLFPSLPPLEEQEPVRPEQPAPEPMPPAEPFPVPLDAEPPLSPAPPVPEEPEGAQKTPAQPVEPLPPPVPRNEPEPFVDPLDRLFPSSPLPEREPPLPPEEPPLPPIDFGPPLPPEEPPLPPIDFGPMPQPVDQPPMLEPVPSKPRPQEPIHQEPPPNVPPWNEPGPVSDPLDTPPPIDRQSQPEPPWKPTEPPPVSENPVELELGIHRLPKGDDERFLIESGSPRANLFEELRLDAWEEHLEHKRREPLPLRSYWDRLSPEDKRRLEADLAEAPPRTGYDPGPEPSRTEMNLGIEKRLPASSSVREPMEYQIVIENRGPEMIDAVDVDEAVPPTHELIDVSPAAYFDRDLLRWRLKDLRPGEQRRLSVEVVPTETGAIETITSVRPMARVGFLTEVENSRTAASETEVTRPSIRLRRSGYPTIWRNETVLFTNHVQNLGASVLHELEIVEQVPEGFRVVRVENEGIYDPQAGTITWRLAELPAGETAKLSVRLKAESGGELVSRVKGHSREGEAVPIRARVQVNPFQARRNLGPSPGPCSCGESCSCPNGKCCCR